jgi:hypothetical protein
MGLKTKYYRNEHEIPKYQLPLSEGSIDAYKRELENCKTEYKEYQWSFSEVTINRFLRNIVKHLPVKLILKHPYDKSLIIPADRIIVDIVKVFEMKLEIELKGRRINDKEFRENERKRENEREEWVRTFLKKEFEGNSHFTFD